MRALFTLGAALLALAGCRAEILPSMAARLDASGAEAGIVAADAAADDAAADDAAADAATGDASADAGPRDAAADGGFRMDSAVMPDAFADDAQPVEDDASPDPEDAGEPGDDAAEEDLGVRDAGRADTGRPANG